MILFEEKREYKSLAHKNVIFVTIYFSCSDGYSFDTAKLESWLLQTRYINR